jgi:hypothetical protein
MADPKGLKGGPQHQAKKAREYLKKLRSEKSKGRGSVMDIEKLPKYSIGRCASCGDCNREADEKDSEGEWVKVEDLKDSQPVYQTNRVHYWHSKEYLESTKSDYAIETVEEYNALVKAIREDKDWYKPVMELVIDYLDRAPGGGCLHIVLEDGNLSNFDINWCQGAAYGLQDHEASDIADLMSVMSDSQRRRVYEGRPG